MPQHELDVAHDVYKRRIGKDGVEVGEVISQKVAKRGSTEAIGLIQGQVRIFKGDGLGIVREANRDLGNAMEAAGCILTLLSSLAFWHRQMGEGCNVYGTLSAQKVSGNFHFSLHAQDFSVLTSVFPDRRVCASRRH